MLLVGVRTTQSFGGSKTSAAPGSRAVIDTFVVAFGAGVVAGAAAWAGSDALAGSDLAGSGGATTFCGERLPHPRRNRNESRYVERGCMAVAGGFGAGDEGTPRTV